MDKYGQLTETYDWQEVVLQDRHEFGSFDTIKIKLAEPFLFVNSKGVKVQMKETKLDTARGYWSLDGREFTVVANDKHKKLICHIRTEDCGMGAAKAIFAIEYFGYKFAGFMVNKS